jgi:NTE family protein
MIGSRLERDGEGRRREGGVALALQGGGAHGAFTWGVLDRLLEEGLEISAISGVSSGAITGAMLVQGLVRGGPEGARRELRGLWERVSGRGGMDVALDGWFCGIDMLNAVTWRGLETMLQVFSPAQLNPFGHNPLRPLLARLLDPALLAHPMAPRLTVAATEIETGVAVLFDNAAIDVDVLLASSCVPLLFPAVEIDGRAFWDGGCAGNPPLGPLLLPDRPAELILVRAQPIRRPGLPCTPVEIMNRLNEIACNNVLQAELAGLPPSVQVTEFDADGALLALPVSSKFSADPAVLRRLFAAGRAAAEARIGAPARAVV